MTKLLVSVRDATEAKAALDAGVDLIDIKEPRQGSLGKAEDGVIEGISRVVQDRRPLSVALGELSDYPVDDSSRLALPPTIRFAKIGLARCENDSSWPMRLATFWKRLSPAIGRIAVIYADWQTADAPPPRAVLDQARKLNCRGVLVDTFDKTLPALTALWPSNQIQELVSAAHECGMIAVLAGRVSADDVAQLLLCGPDYIAVRGAVCHPDRNGVVEAARIHSFRKLLAANLELA
jgi:(5-formylfuran-3-yl)methyl phosphate synthase